MRGGHPPPPRGERDQRTPLGRGKSRRQAQGFKSQTYRTETNPKGLSFSQSMAAGLQINKIRIKYPERETRGTRRARLLPRGAGSSLGWGGKIAGLGATAIPSLWIRSRCSRQERGGNFCLYQRFPRRFLDERQSAHPSDLPCYEPAGLG